MPRPLFHPPARPTTRVAKESGIEGLRGMILSTLPARLAWAMYLRRRVPARVLRARAAARAPTSPVIVSGERRAFRGGLVVGVAPGERSGLDELIVSLRRYEGEDIKIVVADDLTGEYPDEVVARDYPDIDFVRPLIPSGSSYCAFRTLQPAFLHMIRTYEAPVVLKADPDSMVIGEGAFDQAAARFHDDPTLGILGTTEVNATGRTTDYRWAGWMAHPELRWSPRFRRLVRSARAAVGELDFAQAGAYFVSTAALHSALAQGLLPYRQPQWSLQVDDVIMDLIVQAAGYRVRSFGAPGDPIASDTNALPLEPAELLAGGFKLVHSVRSSPAGLTEQEVRRFFGEARDGTRVAADMPGSVA